MFENILEPHREEQDNLSQLLELKIINAEEFSKDTSDMCVEIGNLNLNKDSDRHSVTGLKIDICNQSQFLRKELEVISRNSARRKSDQDKQTYVAQTPYVEDKTSIHVQKEELETQKVSEDHKATSGIVEFGTIYTNPKVDMYPKSGGARDQDWVNFIDEIDTFQESHEMPDAEIVSKILYILKGVAYVWSRAIHREKQEIERYQTS
ncbi:hypothetical protein DFH28DRAFT_936352 [Melampsora americana]|nr:hypothetical protein DFH28DRAFT_936352 [Melampsora americana]